LEYIVFIEKNVKYFHHFIQVINFFQLFFTWDLKKKSKLEIQIVKSGYENWLLSHLWKPPYLRIGLIEFKK
jgi:hypothetical protein